MLMFLLVDIPTNLSFVFVICPRENAAGSSGGFLFKFVITFIGPMGVGDKQAKDSCVSTTGFRFIIMGYHSWLPYVKLGCFYTPIYCTLIVSNCRRLQ